jgi:recombinational DNA repair protein RecR
MQNTGCKQVLNRFTTDEVCEVCKAKDREKERQSLLGMLNGQ